MKTARKWIGGIMLGVTVFPSLAWAEIRAEDFHPGHDGCLWQQTHKGEPLVGYVDAGHGRTPDPVVGNGVSVRGKDCAKAHTDHPGFNKWIAYLNSLPGETDYSKMIESVRRDCLNEVPKKLNGFVGKSIQLVVYCSQTGKICRPQLVKRIARADGETLVAACRNVIFYVDSKTDKIIQVAN